MNSSRRPVAAAWLACALGAGCAAVPPPPDFDPTRAEILAATRPPAIDINGLPGGKLVGAGVGAGTGSGIGTVAGIVACLATGPMAPFCALMLVPTGAAIGAVSGAVVGGIRTESTEAMAIKTKALTDELSDPTYQTLLARQLREAIEAGEGQATPPPPGIPWTLDIGIAEVATEGKGRFALRLLTRMSLRRGEAVPVWRTAKEVQSNNELTADEWFADDSKTLRSVLRQCVEQAARRLAADLSKPVPGTTTSTRPARGRPSNSCEDTPLPKEAS